MPLVAPAILLVPVWRLFAARRGKKAGKAQRAPGLLARHYSPGTRLRLVARIEPAEVLAAVAREALEAR